MVDIVDPFDTSPKSDTDSGIVDPFDTTTKTTPQPESTASRIGSQALRAVTDVPSEIANEAVGGYKELSENRISPLHPIETARAVMGAGRALASPITGTARSILGHGMTAAEMAAGEYGINPIVEYFGGKPQHPDPEKMYTESKGDVDKALSAIPANVAVRRPPPLPLPADEMGITLTQAERSGDLAARQFEQGAMRGQHGQPAQEAAQEFMNVQRPQQIAEARENITRALDTQGNQIVSSNPLDAAETVQRQLQRESARTKAQVDAAYKRARDAGGELHTSTFEDMPNGIKNDLWNDPNNRVIVDDNTPVASRMLAYLDREIGELNITNRAMPQGTGHAAPGPAPKVGVSLEGVDQWRKNLSRMRGEALANAHNNPSDARAVDAVMHAFDERINAGVNNPGMFSGSRDAVDAWNRARDMAAQRFRTWGNDPAGKMLQTIVGNPRLARDPASLNKVADMLLTSQGTGATEQNVVLARRVRDVLGEDSPEWAMIRQGIFQRIAETPAGMQDRGPGVIANRIATFFNGKGSDLANIVFTPDQRRLINRFGELHRMMQVPQQGANWPNTAAGVIPHIQAAAKRTIAMLGALVGHHIAPLGGELVGYAGGRALGNYQERRAAREALQRVEQQMPIVAQRFAAWQRESQAAARSGGIQNTRSVAFAASQLASALVKAGVNRTEVLHMFANGPEGPGTSNAEGNPPHRAEGGAVNDDSGPSTTMEEYFKNPERGYKFVPGVSDATPNDTGPKAEDLARQAASTLPTQQQRLPEPIPDQQVEQQIAKPIEEPSFWDRATAAASQFADKMTDPTGFSEGTKVGNRLFGTGGEERYQTWPERMVRSGFTLPGDVMSGETPFYTTDETTGEQVINPEVIHRSLDTAGLAGVGGVGGTGAEAGTALGAGPFLRPALKYEGKVYKAPQGGQHMDAVPAHLQDEFTRAAMRGDDISNYNFGFMNHKGQFLSREAALDYAIKEGLIDPSSAEARAGVLTSTMYSDTTKPGAAIAGVAKSESPFFSAVENAVVSSKNSKMQGEQWANWLKNQPGVKPDELQWTGIDKWLRDQKGPVTKDQVLDQFKQNKVELQDVGKGNYYNELRKSEGKALLNKVNELEAAGKKDTPEYKEAFDRLQEVRNQSQAVQTKYHSYTLPGGENYREHLITLPSSVQNVDAIRAKLEAVNKAIGRKNRSELGDAEYERLIDERHQLDDELSAAKERNRSANDYKSSHWDEPNILAHMRTNERNVDGKPSFHIEEIQSDWHQAGRKSGYRGSAPEGTTAHWVEGKGWQLKDKDGSNIAVVPDRHRTLTPSDAIKELGKSGVPNAPFKKDWAELALKRMIRQAAEEGKDRISWTPGEAQAARYNLRKQIEELRAYEQPDGTYNLLGMPSSGHSYHEFGRGIPKEKLSEYIGKDVAEKLLNQPKTQQAGGGFHELKGAQLEVGGEGMKGFYDNMLPKMVEKLGKKYGVKVKKGEAKGAASVSKEDNWMSGERAMELTGVTPAEWEANANNYHWRELLFEEARKKLAEKHGAKQQVWYFDMPKEMRDEVLSKGFPMFTDTTLPATAVASEEKKNVRRPVQQKKNEAEIKAPERAAGGRVVAANVEQNPSEKQKNYGNYKKDHVWVQGLDISIENARGHSRKGVGKDGKEWHVKMPAHYGYLKRTEGADGDHVDVYLGPHLMSKKVYVINQIDAETKKFDEHKVMLGFGSVNQAVNTYEKGFSDGKGHERIGSIVPLDIASFKHWLKNGNTKRPSALN